MEVENVRAAGAAFARYARECDRAFKRARVSAPSLEQRQEFTGMFWKMIDAVVSLSGGRRAAEVPELQRALLEEIDPVLLRSELFARSRFCPHGYSGDYRTFELIYDLEADPGGDPTTSAIVNCLAHTYSTIASVPASWERRHRLADIIERRLEQGPVRLLDVACGGSRYVRDVLARSPHAGRLEALCMDQDAATIAFLRGATAEAQGARIETVCCRLNDLPAVIAGRQFDLAVASGLTDYLEDATARSLFELFAAHLAPGGTLFTTNLRDVDLTPFCFDWLVNWPIVHREPDQVLALLPRGFTATPEITPDNSLVVVEASRA